MADGKWFTGLTPDMPVHAAARLILGERFATVRQYLTVATEKPFEDPEYVHQLRVGTRRATAALRVFSGCLPRKFLKNTRRCLRTIRRAAGDARDWDVFLQNLPGAKPLSGTAARPALDFLIGYALGQRSAAQGRLNDAAASEGAEFSRYAEELPARITTPAAGPPDLGSLAAVQFGQLLRTFDDAVRADPSDTAQLHQLRILGKRTRYALEVFAPCFPAGFTDTVYPAVEQAQELLGQIQDAVVGRERLTGLRDRVQVTSPTEWPRLKPGFEGLIRQLRAKQNAATRGFRTWRANWLKLVDGLKVEIVAATVSTPA